MPGKDKFYHLKTVYNFIHHFNEIDRGSQEKVGDLLFEYVDYISKNDVDSYKDAKSLFDNFLLPVGSIYKKQARFTYLIRPRSIVVYLVFLNVLFFTFRASNYPYLVLNAIVLPFLYLMYTRSKTTRVFRFDW